MNETQKIQLKINAIFLSAFVLIGYAIYCFGNIMAYGEFPNGIIFFIVLNIIALAFGLSIGSILKGKEG